MNHLADYLPKSFSLLLELNRGFLIASFIFYCYQGFLNIQMFAAYKLRDSDREDAVNRTWFGIFAGLFCLAEYTSLYATGRTYSNINYFLIYLTSMWTIFYYCRSMREYYFGGEKIRKFVCTLLASTMLYSTCSFAYQFFIDPSYPFFSWIEAPELDNPLLAVAYNFRRPQFTLQFAIMNLGFMASFGTLLMAMLLGYKKRIYRDKIIFWGTILSITTVFYEVFFSTFHLEYFMTIIYIGYFPELTRTTLLAQKKLYSELVLEKDKNQRLVALKQEQIQQSKLKTLYNFSRSIAHEVNNPLSVITLTAELLKKYARNNKLTNEDVDSSADSIKESVKRISKIISILRVIAQEKGQEKSFGISPAEMVESVITLFQSSLESLNIRLEFNASEDFRIVQIDGNHSQISASIYEIIQNAIEAVEKTEDRWIRISGEKSGYDVVIRISNSGPKISAENESKLFEPFFTTKPLNQGLGLNLAKAKSVFQEHGGDVIYDDSREHTTFVLILHMNPP